MERLPGMLKKVQGLFTRPSEEATPKAPSVPKPAPARRGEMDPPRRSISRVSNETFETQLDELDRLFADELVSTVQPKSEPEPEPAAEQLTPAPPPAPVQHTTEPRRGRRLAFPWPAPLNLTVPADPS